MWILECDGDILQNKRIWLRPGKQYLFGRTNPEGGRYAGFTISHKSVSRKHLTLAVAPAIGLGSSIHTRSELSLEDENTKVGTEIDGERVRGEKRILKNDEHVFRLGSYEHLFRIKWHAVVLSFTFPSKDMKGGKDPLIPARSRLEDLDVKVTTSYIIDKTTHVVSSKRNTPKCLQALINGKFIVDNSFLDALVYAATPGNLDELESLSPLEEDFAQNWPNELEHLPPPSKEPDQRSNDFFSPNPARNDIFEGYTFVFCNLRQFENLQAPITNGHGKALPFDVVMGTTSANDVVRFAKNAAGEKGIGEFEDGSEGRGVVIVRFQGDKGFEDWAIELQNDVAQTLDLRLIEQNEFLDAILINDASKLRRALPEPSADSIGISVTNSGMPNTPNRAYLALQRPVGAAANTAVTVPSNPTSAPPTQPSENNAPTSAQAPQISQPRRARTRGTIVSAFKGFDDGYEVTQRKPTIPGSEMRTRATQHADALAESAMEIDERNHNDETLQPNNPRKRPIPSDDEDEDDVNDSLLPAAAAMKRRKLMEEKEGREQGVPAGQINGKSQKKPVPAPRKARVRKEVNIQEVVRERREAEEEAARREEELLRENLDGIAIEEMRNLAVIELMEVPERTARPRRQDLHCENDRWDEQWNGRKNFKKFRRRGLGEQPRRVIVALEETRKRDYGFNEESEKQKRIRREKERYGQSQSQQYAAAASQHEEEVLSEPLTGQEAEIIDVDAPRTTRLADSTLRSQSEHNSNRSHVTNGKRSASRQGSRAPTKRQKLLAPGSESDSEDELKFRFKKRK